MSPAPVNPLKVTHSALFDTWFPVASLPIPAQIRDDIGEIASQVSEQMWTGLQQSPAMLDLLGAMSAPQRALPPVASVYLRQLKVPAVDTFLDRGYAAVAGCDRLTVFSKLFESTDATGIPQPSLLANLAMVLRELYLSTIWDLPLAVPLTGIDSPKVFIDQTAVYAKLHAPQIPPSRLYFDSATATIRHKDGPIDYLVVGSGPGGATVAHELLRAPSTSGRPNRVVLIEKGPFVVWGSMDTRSFFRLMYQGNRAHTADNGIIIRSGETMGGGSTVNIDLAFSPLEATVTDRIDRWRSEGRVDQEFYSAERLAVAYSWVRQKIQTRELSQTELNRDNLVLWNGARELGVDPDLYHLNRYAPNLSPSPVDDKRDASWQLLWSLVQDPNNPLSVIPDAQVDQIEFHPAGSGESADAPLAARGALLTLKTPWTDYGNTVVDPCHLGIPTGVPVHIEANQIILAAGTIGTTRILLKTAAATPAFVNDNIGRGLILHPSMPLIGLFDAPINLLEGLGSATHVDSFAIKPGVIYETMDGLPSYGAVMIPGTAIQVFEQIRQFNDQAGFGVMLVDTPSRNNQIVLSDNDDVALQYSLSDSDKERFREGIAIGIRMMFLAGAKQVIVPSCENLLGLSNFDPTQGIYLTSPEQAEAVRQNLRFIPNRTILTAAHLQATNKMGLTADPTDPGYSVVSPRQRVWNWNSQTRKSTEIPNLYVMDSSIFPTSVGANPMQSIYTFAKIFCDRLRGGMPAAPEPLPAMTPSGNHHEAAPPVAFPQSVPG